MKILAVIIVAGSKKQKECFWPSYHSVKHGIEHDLIVVHRNMQFVPVNINNKNIIHENKITKNGFELPHKAFGAYREYWKKYKNEYKYFAFISDDVIIKSDNWLLKAIQMLEKFDKLGFVGTQIFNGNLGQYPHPSHCRAPVWFAKSNALSQIDWEFSSDHDGEMKLADQFVAAGFYGAQIGNKIDIAYDAIENGGCFIGDHISSLMEKYFNHDLKEKFTEKEINNINKTLKNKLLEGDDSIIIQSPFDHLGKKHLISQIQPFNGLIYDKSVELAGDNVKKYEFNTYILKGCL